MNDDKEAILEQWFARTVELYPQPTAEFLAAEKDPFRNPIGHTLREGLAVLLEEIVGRMNPERIGPALDNVVRMRAVQDFTPSEAVSFVFLLRPILREFGPPRPAMIESHIDQLALLAFNNYMRCREQVALLRAKESRRRDVVQTLRHG
ncbi:MAG: RsbRD N-terminal domain-containing protein [Terriglobales bacterium]